ncbi:MAG: PAS domain S-box protein [Proteobacteria bacterium]|nr:PAS domain S-box protein [Pseudomonadota bacterium]
MKNFARSKIVKRLLLSFFALIILFMICGFIFLSDANKMATLTRTIYNHPLVVSNTSLLASVAVMKIHQNMKDLVTSESSSEIADLNKKNDSNEKRVYDCLNTIRENILGQEGKDLEIQTRALFSQWKPIRENTLMLIRSGRKKEASKIIKTISADHVEKLELQMNMLSEYAFRKASGFMKHTEDVEKNIIRRTLLLLVSGTVLALLIAFFTIKKLLSIETELNEERNRLAITMHAIGDAVIATDRNGCITLINEVAGNLTGWIDKDALGKPLGTVLNIINEYTREPTENPVSKVINTGHIQGLANHTLLISKDGKEYNIDDSAAPILDEKNTLLGVILVFRDVTHEKQAMRELYESRAILQAAMDNSQAGIVIADAPTGEIRYVNQAGLMIPGRSKDEIVNNIDIDKYVASWRIFHFDGTPYMRDEVPLARAILYNETCSRELILRKNNGEDRYVFINAAPVNNPEGDVIAGIAVFLDITDRIHANMKIIESEERWKSLSQSSPDHILLLDRKLDIQFANSASPGLTTDQLIGTNIISYIENNQQAKIKTLLESIFETGLPANYETSYIRPDNQIVYYESRVIPRKLSGDIVGLTLSARDITDKKRMEIQKELLEAKLRQAQKMEAIGTLSGGIAHDFNNILAIILGNAELAMEDGLASDSLQTYLNEIKIAGLRARQMVKQILNFSRQSSLEKEPVNISQLVIESLRLIRSSLPTTIHIDQDIPFISTVIMANPTQVNQVLMNLCINASHAMNNEGTLSVNLEQIWLGKDDVKIAEDLKPGNYVRLSVIDTGHGISEDIANKIFDPYFTTKETGKGTGMGLSVVYGIVKAHQGAITLYSEAGKGTIFHVYLPTIDKKIREDTASPSPTPRGNERILLVDDEEMIIRMAEKILTSLGYTVDSFQEPEKALRQFQKTPDHYDMVITDMTMPGLSGIRLSAELNKIRADIPILLCTGYSEKINETTAHDYGISKFLIKPITKLIFAESIREVLKNRQSVS